METVNTPIQKGTVGFVNDQSVVLDIVGNDLVASGVEVLFRVLRNRAYVFYKPIPEFIVFDLDFHDSEVLDLLAKFKRAYPSVRFIAHTSIDDKELLEILLNIGFDGYLLMGSDADDFKNAINAISNGKKYLSTGVAYPGLDFFQKYRSN
jgi:DNA-binding NarL/FixJ family response regulator